MPRRLRQAVRFYKDILGADAIHSIPHSKFRIPNLKWPAARSPDEPGEWLDNGLSPRTWGLPSPAWGLPQRTGALFSKTSALPWPTAMPSPWRRGLGED